MVARKKLTMSEDKKKKEESKSTLRFDNDDWIIPSEDEIRKKNPKKYKKNGKGKKEDWLFTFFVVTNYGNKFLLKINIIHDFKIFSKVVLLNQLSHFLISVLIFWIII